MKARNGYGVSRCAEPVPSSLSGGLGAFKCALECGPTGYHTGDHKAHYSVPHCGRITWRWKNKMKPPPVIVLPPPPRPLRGRRPI